ncbi:MAG: glycoside hydrolase N-terminal domain-containing protein [Clostridia bacterium]|nr:glycoside hydrolase N-terminal domain-containing protein [Clostridia bacterium]
MLKLRLKLTSIILIVALSCAVILSGFLPMLIESILYGDFSMIGDQKNISFANTFSELYSNCNNSVAWREGMVSGNGINGVVVAGSPYNDTHIYQNIYFIMPSADPRYTPEEVGSELHDARQAVINLDDTWDVGGRNRTFDYAFHPSHRLRITQTKRLYRNYIRWTNYETAELGVRYTDIKGTWERVTFTSREDNVTITKLTQSDRGNKLNLTISIDDNSTMPNFGRGDEAKMLYKKVVDENCNYIAEVAHYPSYDESELKNGGYVGFTQIITVGGTKQRITQKGSRDSQCVSDNYAVKISDAEEVYLITISDRTFDMGEYDDFRATASHPLLDSLYAHTDAVVKKYSENGCFSYQKSLIPHTLKHGNAFKAVDFEIGGDGSSTLSNEKLLKKQRASKNIEGDFIERAYNQGRYNQLCCGGSMAPRLYGMWTGEWNPGWRSIYTMDANVNLQVSGMNTGNVYEAGVGYIKFILRQIPDWEDNAKKVYGMVDAIQAPVNTDGDRAMMVEYDKWYPFEYWNAGASWLLTPIYEFWQCYGNTTIEYQGEQLDLERDVLLPLLTKQANFWDQLCTPEYYTDVNGKACYQKGKTALNEGERYVIIPSYSPENNPLGYTSTITANATMDISSAREGLNMTIVMENVVKASGYEDRIAKWSELLSLLPEYKFDETGALCEWAMSEYQENNEHRHISHLYPAWPAYETQTDDELKEACNIAIDNRNRLNKGKDDTASHGWVHKVLVGARLKNADSTAFALHTLVSSKIYFTSLMTDHNIDRRLGVYCTDTGIGMVGMIDEMLLYSNTGVIEALPAIPTEWTQGSIQGLRARTNAQVDIWWTETQIQVTVTSDKEQNINRSFYGQNQVEASFMAGESKTFTFTR